MDANIIKAFFGNEDSARLQQAEQQVALLVSLLKQIELLNVPNEVKLLIRTVLKSINKYT